MSRATFLRLLVALTLGRAAPLVAQETARDTVPPLQRGDSLLPFRGGTLLWVFNPGTDTVWVDTLYLRACQNVYQPCAPTPVNVPVPPGETRHLLRLTPKSPRDPFNYRWTYAWRVVTRVEGSEVYIKPEPLGAP